MRRVASSKVYINNEEFYNNHIVELFDSFVVNHYGLQSELPMTEWLGGVIVFLHAELTLYDLLGCKSISDFFRVAECAEEHCPLPFAWHITNVDLETGMLTPSSIITMLEDKE